MITGRLRALSVLLRAWRSPVATVSRLDFVVLPTDIDLNRHLTNSRYPQLMDLGRLDLLTRSGAGMDLYREGTGTVLVELSLVFKRDLPLGTRFVLETQVTGRDRRALVFEQRFCVGETVHAIGTAKMVLLWGGKVIEPDALSARLIESGDHTHGSARRSAQ